jgi:hypothetical protein
MPPLRRAEIQADCEALLYLAEALGSGRPLGVEGLAMALLLISDAPSPLYHSDASRSLALSSVAPIARCSSPGPRRR